MNVRIKTKQLQRTRAAIAKATGGTLLKTQHTPAYTPAPWTVSNNRIHGTVGSGACQGIADMLGNCGVTATVNANALLIAASPELLEALRNLLLCVDAGDLDSLANASETARAVIERASSARV